MGKIIVIGSSNTDMIIHSEHLPAPGETVLGGEFLMAGGGKGANQAVAAARLGASTVFVCKVGDDVFGHEALARYKQDHIDTCYSIISETKASGVALIMVDKKAENCISVAGGANNALMPADLDKVLETLNPDDIVLLQLEIPIQTVCYAIDKAALIGARVILNPAPAASVPEAQLAKLYMITPNETEASLLTGISLSDADFVSKAMHRLHQMGVCNVLMTLGGNGSALLNEQSELTYFPAEKVEAVDTTAAGDTFNGALCVALIEGKNIADSIRFASHAAALSVMRMGAQTSIPSRQEVDDFLKNN